MYPLLEDLLRNAKAYLPTSLADLKRLNIPPILVPIAGFLLVVTLIAGLWFVLWKVGFEPNPLVREFLDLDKTLTERRPKTSLSTNGSNTSSSSTSHHSKAHHRTTETELKKRK